MLSLDDFIISISEKCTPNMLDVVATLTSIKHRTGDTSNLTVVSSLDPSLSLKNQFNLILD